jgi:hypothetical protein
MQSNYDGATVGMETATAAAISQHFQQERCVLYRTFKAAVDTKPYSMKLWSQYEQDYIKNRDIWKLR